jgi:hypothetical protein
MADRIVNEGQTAELEGESAETLRAYAKALLREMGEDTDKAFAVAAAGAKYVGENDINAKVLFDVIREICEDARVANSLTKVIDQLADRAAARAKLSAREVSHG